MGIIRKSLVAGAVVAAVAPMLLALAASAATPQPGTSSQTYPTKIARVHVRSLPDNSAASRILATIDTAGTNVTVTCYVHVTSGTTTHTWYKSLKPAGYIAGRNLATPRHQATGLPAC